MSENTFRWLVAVLCIGAAAVSVGTAVVVEQQRQAALRREALQVRP